MAHVVVFDILTSVPTILSHANSVAFSLQVLQLQILYKHCAYATDSVDVAYIDFSKAFDAVT